MAARLGSERRDLAPYARLELAIAGTIVCYTALRPVLPGAVVALARHLPNPIAAAVLALAVLAVPTILLGATLPAACATLTPGDTATAGRLYAWNTLGGAAGALACGLVGIRVLGMRASFVAAAAVDLGVGGAALLLRREQARPSGDRSAPAPPARYPAAVAAAAVAGFIGLAGEVLWSRGLAGVLSNSVYSVAIVLAAVLLGLVGGARLAAATLMTGGGHAEREARSGPIGSRLAVVFAALALSTSASVLALRVLPDASLALAGRLAVTGPGAGFAVEAVLALLVVLGPGLCLGAAFPLALALAGDRSPGRATGVVLAADTAGGIAGALGAAFVILPRLGLGPGLLFLAGVATATAVVLAGRTRARLAAGTSAVAVVVAAIVAPTVRVASRAGGDPERLLFSRDGPGATVTVTADARGAKRLRLDGQYSLGGSDGLFLERRQAHVPLLLHPAPGRLLALGVGTADTVGAALAAPDVRVDAVELLPEVLDAAHLFRAENGGALADPRVRTVVDDARSFLLATDERWDVVLADLFLPWTAGAASLYSVDFYRLGRAHLRPGGLYCQWLPLHQLGVEDLVAIVASFAAVFPDTELWVAYHRAATPLAALIGSTSRVTAVARPWAAASGLDDPADLAVLYVADGKGLRAATAGVAPITDDRPRLDFTAPRAYFHQEGVGRAALAWIAARLDPEPAPVPAAPPAAASAEVRAILLRAQLALLAGDRFGEAVAYLDALALAPEARPVRQAVAAIGGERLTAGDRAAARRIARELETRAPGSPEAVALARRVPAE